MFCSFATLVVFITLAKICESNEYQVFRSTPVYLDNNNRCGKGGPDKPSTPSGSSPSKNLEDEFNKGNLQFTSNFFYNVVKANSGKSVTLSPYSVLFLLAQLAIFATGETVQQLLSALNLEKQNEIKEVIPVVLDSIAQQKNVTLNLATRVYGNTRSKFSNSFKNITKVIFRAEAENINFDDPQVAANIINKWVADNTNNKIKDLVPASILTPNTELVLANALYFRGVWRYTFKTDNTKPQNFYQTEKKTITIDMMNQQKYFKYANNADLNAQAIELPYVNNNLTCLILLPNDKCGATMLVKKLLNTKSLTSAIDSLQSTKVNLYLPKFNTTTTSDLKDILQKLNITALFDLDSSDLSGILSTRKKLYVSAGIQKVNIEVNESGSEASAGNAIIGVAATAVMPSPPILFNADHPFIYYLLFNRSPIFCGLFAGN